MLLDTSGLMRLFDPRDFRHPDAPTLYDAAHTRLIHNHVFAELVALTHARGAPRGSALDFVLALHADPEVEAVWVDESLQAQASNLLRERQDKDRPPCDAVSILLVRPRGLTDALTTGHHFGQAGLRRLLAR